MRQWFESLPSRDQIALMALVAALGLWLFVQLIFIELDGDGAADAADLGPLLADSDSSEDDRDNIATTESRHYPYFGIDSKDYWSGRYLFHGLLERFLLM